MPNEKPGFTVTTRDGSCTVDGVVVPDPHDPANPAPDNEQSTGMTDVSSVPDPVKVSKSSRGVTANADTP